MARRRERDDGKERYWRQLLNAWGRSGQSVRAFCSRHGLSEASFHAWRRTIRERDGQQLPRALPPAFVPVTVTAGPATLEVVLADGRVVRVPAGFDAASLRQILAILAEVPPC